LIAADQFMEKDHEGQSHWIPLGQYMVIQGLLAEWKKRATDLCGDGWSST